MANPNPITLEAELLERLAPLRSSGLLVHALPQRPKEYGEMLEKASRGILTLLCFDEQPRSERGVNPRVQVVTYSPIVLGRVKGLRDEAGLLVLQQDISALLLGFQPTGCGPVRLGSGFQFLGRTDTDWEFQVGYSVLAMRRG